MAQRTVDGLVVPQAVSGHPALELVNTRAGYDGEQPREYLQSFAHLSTAARANGLLTVRRSTALRALAADRAVAARRELGRAVRFRDALHAVLTERAGRTELDLVATELRRMAGRRSLVAVGRGRSTWATEGDPLREPLDSFGWQAHQLLDDEVALAQVRRCPGRDCGWLFLDPPGRRRWCLMAVCGNREKARRYADRDHRR